METQLAELHERLDRGQRELQALRRHLRLGRLLTRLVVGSAVAFVATRSMATQGQLLALAQAGSGTLVKGPLVIVDDAGHTILQVGTSPIGRGMVLFDPAGKLVCGIGLTAQGRGIAVY